MDEIVELTPEQKLNNSTSELATEIVQTEDLDKVKDLTSKFNLAQVKKNVLRTVKMNDLMDQIISRVSDRFESRPDEFSNKDLTDYLKAAQDVLDKVTKGIQNVDTVDAIQLNQHNVNINIGGESLPRESREKIMDAITSILSRASNEASQNEEEKIDYEVEDDESEEPRDEE